MKQSFPNQATYNIWKLIEFQRANNLKTPLGLFSLLINLDPQVQLEEVNIKLNDKDNQMEM